MVFEVQNRLLRTPLVFTHLHYLAPLICIIIHKKYVDLTGKQLCYGYERMSRICKIRRLHFQCKMLDMFLAVRRESFICVVITL